MKAYLCNPLSEYLRYLWNRLQNRRRFTNFDQAYMALVRRTVCGPNFRVDRYSSIDDSSIGAYSYVSHHTEIFRARIGKFCSIGPGCRIGLGTHPTDHISTSPVFFSTREQTGISFVSKDLFEESQEITIGNDVWVGANSVILDGVEIGTGAIIAAGAVVTRDVDPYAIVGGVPATRRRMRFSEAQIQHLLRSQWWDWDPEKLSRHAVEFSRASHFIDEVLGRDASTPED